MRVISKARLSAFWTQSKFADSESPLKSWYTVVSNRNVDWSDNSDIKETFASASIVCKCVVFNIGGNKYRLITRVNFRNHCVYVRYVTTHREYDKKEWLGDCDCEKKKMK